MLCLPWPPDYGDIEQGRIMNCGISKSQLLMFSLVIRSHGPCIQGFHGIHNSEQNVCMLNTAIL